MIGFAPPQSRATSRFRFCFGCSLRSAWPTIPFSAQHMDGSMMIKLAEWGQQAIVTFNGGGRRLLVDAGWVFRLHMFLGMTIFLIFPFTRLVHVWSGFASIGCVLRPYQLVRSRRIGVGEANPPASAAATVDHHFSKFRT